jgi:hypothetical protein
MKKIQHFYDFNYLSLLISHLNLYKIYHHFIKFYNILSYYKNKDYKTKIKDEYNNNCVFKFPFIEFYKKLTVTRQYSFLILN